jgi:hypothetical protein
MATYERQIETPVGVKVGRIFEALEVLGIASYFTQSGNRSNAERAYEEIVNIEVPVGTYVVVPAPNLWWLGHGSLQPEMSDPLNDMPDVSWETEDHNWGAGRVEVDVLDLSAPDFTQNPPKQTARLYVRMYLADDNADDSWFGAAGYCLLFLGQAPRPPRPTGTNQPSRRKTWAPMKIRKPLGID